jgi:hypothetical protein
MTNNTKEFVERDAYKTRIYRLCEYLINKRKSPLCRSLTLSLNISLQEMSEIFEYEGKTNETEESKVEK